MGGYRQHRIVHYHNKKMIGELDARTFESTRLIYHPVKKKYTRDYTGQRD